MTPDELLTVLDLKIQELEIEKKKIDMALTQIKAQQAKVQKQVDAQKQAKTSFLGRFTGLTGQAQ